MKRPSLQDVFSHSERIVGRKVDGRNVLVALVRDAADLDALFDLNAPGAFIWERLDGKSSGREIVRGVVERFEAPVMRAARDYIRFVARLESLGALTRRDRKAEAAVP
ncbi:MAG: PqqD family protein [Vicinamibacteria bacterium]|nr:PqqD family protein [Vicinamibacteria bacterium]